MLYDGFECEFCSDFSDHEAFYHDVDSVICKTCMFGIVSNIELKDDFHKLFTVSRVPLSASSHYQEIRRNM